MFVQITCFATYVNEYPSYGRSFCNYNLSYHGNGKSINVFLTRMVYDIQLVIHIPTRLRIGFISATYKPVPNYSEKNGCWDQKFFQ